MKVDRELKTDRQVDPEWTTGQTDTSNQVSVWFVSSLLQGLMGHVVVSVNGELCLIFLTLCDGGSLRLFTFTPDKLNARLPAARGPELTDHDYTLCPHQSLRGQRR